MIKKILMTSGVTLLVVLALNVFLFQYYNRPPERALFIDPVTHFETDEKIVALTFDDGPTKERTAPLLDLLAKHDVKATFFVVGDNLVQDWDVAERALKEGHQLASHTQHHDRMIYKSYWYMENDLERMDGYLLKIGEHDLGYFRPPYGDKMVVLPWLLKQQNKKLITWSVDPMEQYAASYDPDVIFEQVKEQMHPGAIIILHDGVRKDPTPLLEAVDKVITELKKQGYTFVTVKEGLAKTS